MRKGVPRYLAGTLPHRSPEHEPKGKLLGQCLRRIFFKTLKQELETLDGKHTEGEVRQSVFMYIEAYYNRVRRTESPLHSALDNQAPDVFNLEHTD